MGQAQRDEERDHRLDTEDGAREAEESSRNKLRGVEEDYQRRLSKAKEREERLKDTIEATEAKWEQDLEASEMLAASALAASKETLSVRDGELAASKALLQEKAIEHVKEVEQLKSNTEQYVSYRLRDSLQALREEHAAEVAALEERWRSKLVDAEERASRCAMDCMAWVEEAEASKQDAVRNIQAEASAREESLVSQAALARSRHDAEIAEHRVEYEAISSQRHTQRQAITPRGSSRGSMRRSASPAPRDGSMPPTRDSLRSRDLRGEGGGGRKVEKEERGRRRARSPRSGPGTPRGGESEPPDAMEAGGERWHRPPTPPLSARAGDPLVEAPRGTMVEEATGGEAEEIPMLVTLVPTLPIVGDDQPTTKKKKIGKKKKLKKPPPPAPVAVPFRSLDAAFAAVTTRRPPLTTAAAAKGSRASSPRSRSTPRSSLPTAGSGPRPVGSRGSTPREVLGQGAAPGRKRRHSASQVTAPRPLKGSRGLQGLNSTLTPKGTPRRGGTPRATMGERQGKTEPKRTKKRSSGEDGMPPVEALGAWEFTLPSAVAEEEREAGGERGRAGVSHSGSSVASGILRQHGIHPELGGGSPSPHVPTTLQSLPSHLEQTRSLAMGGGGQTPAEVVDGRRRREREGGDGPTRLPGGNGGGIGLEAGLHGLFGEEGRARGASVEKIALQQSILELAAQVANSGGAAHPLEHDRDFENAPWLFVTHRFTPSTTRLTTPFHIMLPSKRR